MNATDLLIEAKGLILDPANWTCEAFGRNDEGGSLAPEELGNAVSYCSEGALIYTSRKNNLGWSSDVAKAWDSLREAYEAQGCSDIINGNDQNNHQFALDRFDDAIRLSKQ